MFSNPNIKRFLVSGLLIRLAVMPVTLHSDMHFIFGTPYFFVEGQWDVYGYMWREFNLHYYPPLMLLFTASWEFLLSSIFHNYGEFLSAMNSLTPKQMLEVDNLFLNLTLSKVPYLIFDAVVVVTGLKICEQETERFRFLALWAFNPVVIYGTYMMGQFDLIPATFIFLSLYLALIPDKKHWAGLTLAAGCLFKVVPILFLPLVICISCRTWKDAFLTVIWGVTPVVVIFWLFYLISEDAVFSIFKLFSYNLSTDFDFKKSLIKLVQVTLYGLLCIHALRSDIGSLDYRTISLYFLCTILSIFLGLNLNWTHYFNWGVPIMVLGVTFFPIGRIWFYGIMTLLFLQGLRAREAAIGLFAPLNPEFFLSIPSLKDATGFLFDQTWYDFFIDALYKAVTLFIIVFIIRTLFENESLPKK